MLPLGIFAPTLVRNPGIDKTMQSQSRDRMLYFARVRTRILKAQWVGHLHFKTFRWLSTLIMDEAAEPARKRRRKDADILATELLASGRLLSNADVL